MAAEDVLSEYDWKQHTIKQLNRTLLFDTDTAIRFVRELGEKRVTSNTEGSLTEDANNSCLTGTEAKIFYESIVTSTSTPCDKIHEENDIRPCKTPKKRKSVKRSTNLSYSLPTIADLFRYAQNDQLSQLSTALSTGRFDINMTDQFDWTLLMTAATAGHMTIVQYLLNEGAEWAGLVDKKKMDAVDLARVSGHADIARYILQHTTHFKEQQVEQQLVPTMTSSSFLCKVCHQVIQNTPTSSHTVSIAHQFSCQHRSPSLPYGLPLSNKGYQMMVRGGWDPERGLGSEGQGRRYPVKTVLKRDRLGVGVADSALVPRVTHFRPGDVSAVKSVRDRKRVNGNDNGAGPRNKKEREKKLRKERRWEIGMRQYMSTDY